jgi:hypothetical protein
MMRRPSSIYATKWLRPNTLKRSVWKCYHLFTGCMSEHSLVTEYVVTCHNTCRSVSPQTAFTELLEFASFPCHRPSDTSASTPSWKGLEKASRSRFMQHLAIHTRLPSTSFIDRSSRSSASEGSMSAIDCNEVDFIPAYIHLQPSPARPPRRVPDI